MSDEAVAQAAGLQTRYVQEWLHGMVAAQYLDYDADNDLDLFLAMRDRENRLFENRGPDGFVDVAAELGVADPRRTVGASWFDTGDGRLDLAEPRLCWSGRQYRPWPVGRSRQSER